jgi:hypothetical protein
MPILLIDKIILLNEQKYDYSFIEDHSKIEETVIGKRACFSDFFNHTNSIYDENDIYMIANSDMYYDNTRFELQASIGKNSEIFKRIVPLRYILINYL